MHVRYVVSGLEISYLLRLRLDKKKKVSNTNRIDIHNQLNCFYGLFDFVICYLEVRTIIGDYVSRLKVAKISTPSFFDSSIFHAAAKILKNLYS